MKTINKTAKSNSVLDGSLRYVIPAALMLIGAGFIVIGIFDEEVNAVFRKAIDLCKECVGIG